MPTLTNDQYQLSAKLAYAQPGLDIGQGSDYRVSQGFTPSVTGTLDSLVLALTKSGAPGDLQIAIHAVDGLGKPTGSALATQVISAASVPASPSTGQVRLDVVFSSPASLTSGTT